MKGSSASFPSGTALLWILAIVMLAVIAMTSYMESQRRKSWLLGSVSASSASSSQPTSSLTELLKKFFGISGSSSSSVFVNPDPTNDCSNTPNPYPQQCIAGQEHCCHGQWICPNVLGQYVCE